MKKYFKYILCFTLLSVIFAACKDDKKDEDKKMDYSALKTLIEECNELYDEAKTTGIYYLEEDLDTFKAAIEKAEKLIKDGASFQTTITTQTKTLTTAKENFIESALNVIRKKDILMTMSFDNDSIAGVINTGGISKVSAKLTNGPKEIFELADFDSYVDRNDEKALLLALGRHVELTDYMADDFLQTQMSFAAWVRIDKANDNNYIASLNYSNNWQLKVDANGEVQFTFVTSNDGGETLQKIEAGSVAKIKAGTWAHVVVSLDLKSYDVASGKDNRHLTFYIDGKMAKSYTVTDLPALNGTVAGTYESISGEELPLMIGAATTYSEATGVIGGSYTADTWGCLRGTIDNFGIYKVAVSRLQVEKLYNDQK